MSVFKVKDRPGYRYDSWLQGHRVRGVAETENRKEAEKIEKAARDAKREELKTGKKPSGVVMRINEATARYNHEVAQHLAGQGADIVFRDLERLEAYFKNVLGEDAAFTVINDAEIAKLVAWRRGQHCWGRETAPLVTKATVNRSTTELLKKLFIRARDTWKVQFADWPTWKTHILKTKSEVINELQEGQGEALMDATRDDYAPAIEFEHVTGWRQGAVIALDWDQVNWGAKTIRFPAREGKEERTIEINAVLRLILWPLRGHHPTRVFTYLAKRTRIVKRMGGDERVIKGQRYPLTPSGFKTEWRRSKAKVGIKKFRNHDLRHDFATKLYDETGDIYAVQNAMGHADVKTTMRYVHRRKGAVNAAVAEIAKKRLRKVPAKSPHQTPHRATAKDKKPLRRRHKAA
jgi:integrase